MHSRRLAVIPALILFVTLSGCGSDDDSTDSPAGTPTASESAADGTCVYQQSGTAAKKVDPPPSEPVAADSMTIRTNRGDIAVTLKPDSAPCTVNSFVSLAEQGYFDDTKCHRLVVGFVLQCGDPSGTGAGGPGYRFADELSGDETYPAGTFAMANSGPDTNGSQFFVVLEDAGLPPQYTVFGTVDAAGLKTARDIAKDGNGPDGTAPAKDVVIEGVS